MRISDFLPFGRLPAMGCDVVVCRPIWLLSVREDYSGSVWRGDSSGFHRHPVWLGRDVQASMRSSGPRPGIQLRSSMPLGSIGNIAFNPQQADWHRIAVLERDCHCHWDREGQQERVSRSQRIFCISAPCKAELGYCTIVHLNDSIGFIPIKFASAHEANGKVFAVRKLSRERWKRGESANF